MRPRTALVVGLALVLVTIAVVVRLRLLMGSGWLLEGDDALSTLMALGIVDTGERPIMLKNQTYASAWEPYMMALAYTAFGISRVAAKLPELVTSILLIPATVWLAAEAVVFPGTASPPAERGVAGGISALNAGTVAVARSAETARVVAAVGAAALMAVPPAYATVLWLKPWAPYTEVVLCGTIALVAAIRLAWPRATRHDPIWAFACGLAGGIGLWMHPLAITYLAAAGLSLIARVRGRRWLTVGGVGLAGFVVGGLPIWMYNLRTGGATVRFILAGTGGQSADRLAVLSAWWSNDLPRGLGLWQPWGASPTVLGAAMAVVVTAALLWALFGRQRASIRPLDSVLLFLVMMPLVLVLSGFGGPALNPYGFDATGRYAPPLWAGVTVVFGVAVASLWRRLGPVAVALVLVPLAINLVSLRATDPVAAFQSPYWTRLPVDSRPLLAALRSLDVQAVWINHWVGQPLMFDARAMGQPLVAYDWYDVQAGGIDRFPEYLGRVRDADRAAFVLVTDEADPELARRLREMDVTFDDVRVPSFVIIVPRSRRVDPSEVTGALDYRY